MYLIPAPYESAAGCPKTQQVALPTQVHLKSLQVSDPHGPTQPIECSPYVHATMELKIPTASVNVGAFEIRGLTFSTLLELRLSRGSLEFNCLLRNPRKLMALTVLGLGGGGSFRPISKSDGSSHLEGALGMGEVLCVNLGLVAGLEDITRALHFRGNPYVQGFLMCCGTYRAHFILITVNLQIAFCHVLSGKVSRLTDRYLGSCVCSISISISLFPFSLSLPMFGSTA